MFPMSIDEVTFGITSKPSKGTHRGKKKTKINISKNITIIGTIT